jgi:hypothetical protein
VPRAYVYRASPEPPQSTRSGRSPRSTATTAHAPFRIFPVAATALILVAAERAKDFPQSRSTSSAPARVSRPRWSARWSARWRIYLLARVPRCRPTAFAEVGITHKDVDHLMIYDAFAHLPIYGLADLGFVSRGRGRRLHRRA